MNARTKLLLLAVAVIAAIATPVWLKHSPPPPATGMTTGAPTAHPPAPSQASTPAEPPLVAASDPGLPDIDLRARELSERAQFHEDMRGFFAHVDELSAADKRVRSEALSRELSHYEAAGEISAAEALTLRVALARETIEDATERETQIAALQQRYVAEGEREEAQWRAQVDPQFDAYQAREREIVEEVMAMSEIPDGLTREEYLRRRLQDAREAAYGAGEQ